MKSLYRFIASPTRCSYLPDQSWCLEYEQVASITAAEYMKRLQEGWRRFGYTLFRPQCPACSACRSLRVCAGAFLPNRSQRRCRKLNENTITLRIGQPRISRAKLNLYDHYHAYQSQLKGWHEHPTQHASAYIDAFVDNPFPTEEWCYYLDKQLIGVGYVDVLPDGLSAIYFFYNPEERERSLGTWNVLNVIAQTAVRHLPHAYLGYYVAGCSSLAYKSHFAPHEILGADGQWHPAASERAPYSS